MMGTKMNRAFRKICIGLCVFILGSCSPELEEGSDYSSTRIAEALAAVQEMRRTMPSNPGLKLTERILSETNHTGPIKEWGCIAVFDHNGELEKAYTLKAMDFETGRVFPIRMYTKDELEQARPQIEAFKTRAGITKHYAIPMYSLSFKLAAADLRLSYARLHWVS